MSYTPVTLTLNSFAFDGTTPSPAGVLWDWVSLDGWFDSPDQRFETHERATGLTATVDRRNGRPMTLTALCHATSDGRKLDDLLYSALRTLKAAVSPAVDIPVLLQVNEPTVPLLAYVRQAAPIRSRMWGTRHGMTVQIPITAPDPRRYSVAVHTSSLSIGTTVVVAAGDLPSPVIYTVVGPAADWTLTNTSLSGAPQLVYGAALGGADTLTVDTSSQTVTVNGADVRANLTVAEWFDLKPGNNSLTVTRATGLTYRDAYS